ncbi:hypothetical protein EC988_006062 [Linderina pennispora]|nr:hypothetical protein EC988_006062 [Linderina pennispora]
MVESGLELIVFVMGVIVCAKDARCRLAVIQRVIRVPAAAVAAPQLASRPSVHGQGGAPARRMLIGPPLHGRRQIGSRAIDAPQNAVLDRTSQSMHSRYGAQKHGLDLLQHA